MIMKKVLRVDSSVKDFETFLQMIYLYFTQPRKDEICSILLSQSKKHDSILRQDPQTFFSDTAFKDYLQ